MERRVRESESKKQQEKNINSKIENQRVERSESVCVDEHKAKQNQQNG